MAIQAYANPFASPGQNGINDPYPNGYVDIPFSYVLNLSLANGNLLSNQSQPVDTDSDFAWRALVIGAGSGFSVRFIDAHGYYLSNDLISDAVLSASSVSPFPVIPELIYPAGGRVALDIQADAGSQYPLTIQLIFEGVKRYKLPAQ